MDAKLGARMLVKHPGVTVVGGLAMAIGICLGAAYLEVVNDFLHLTLPLDESERVVGLQNRDVEVREAAGLLLPSAAVLMLVGLVACSVPLRGALRIEPTEALKEVG